MRDWSEETQIWFGVIAAMGAVITGVGVTAAGDVVGFTTAIAGMVFTGMGVLVTAHRFGGL